MSLREKQSLLVKCLGKFIDYATSQGYELTLGEGYIATPRKTRNGLIMEDGVHMPGSLHYQRLAVDVNLFVNGEYITDGNHPAWRELGSFWLSLDDSCRWGGNFRSGDSNHLSLAHGGRA